MKMCRILLAAVACLTSAAAAGAAPIQWNTGAGANNHYYEYIADRNITWTAANAEAELLSHLGMDGHLATITSDLENDFVLSIFAANVSGVIGPWFGGSQPLDQATPSTGWNWVTGEPWAFTDWRPHDPAIYQWPEPNDVDNQENNQENFLHFHAPGGTWYWNDAANNLGGIPGYLVEYEGAPTAIPEPSTMVLVGLGLAAARARSARRRA